MPPVLTVPGPPHAPSLRRVTSHFLWPCVINSFSGPRDKAGVNLSNKHQVINSEDRGRPCLSLSTRLGSSSPHRTSIYILFCLSLSFCLCSLEVTVTSLYPPRLCRIAVFSIKPTFPPRKYITSPSHHIRNEHHITSRSDFRSGPSPDTHIINIITLLSTLVLCVCEREMRVMAREFYLKNPTPPGAAQAT